MAGLIRGRRDSVVSHASIGRRVSNECACCYGFDVDVTTIFLQLPPSSPHHTPRVILLPIMRHHADLYAYTFTQLGLHLTSFANQTSVQPPQSWRRPFSTPSSADLHLRLPLSPFLTISATIPTPANAPGLPTSPSSRPSTNSGSSAVIVGERSSNGPDQSGPRL